MPSYRKLEAVDCFFSTVFNLKYICEGCLVSEISVVWYYLQVAKRSPLS